MKKFKHKLVISQKHFNGEKVVIYKIRFTRHDLDKVSVECINFNTINAAGYLAARLSIDELISFIKFADLAVTARIRGFNIVTDFEDAIFETIIDEWKQICFHKTKDVVEMFELVFEKDCEPEIEEEENKEEVSKEDKLLEGINGINEKLGKILDLLYLMNNTRK